MTASALKDILRYARLRIRTWLGTDVYVAPQVQVESQSVGGGLAGDYGSWTVALHGLDAESIIYSVGVGDDISFDRALIELTGATVFAFDPTAASIKWLEQQSLPDQFVHHPLGVSDVDGTARFHSSTNPDWVSATVMADAGSDTAFEDLEVRRIATLMKMLGHNHVDLLKMDIEGAEYSVIDDLVNSGVVINQLLVEFHHRFQTVELSDTERALSKLNQAGFDIFSVSPTGEEYSLIRRA